MRPIATASRARPGREALPRIAVFGLGYVGCVTAACLASRGFTIVGLDSQAGKVDTINAGTSPITEPALGQIVRDAADLGRLRATTDSARAVAESDISLVCVGTPSDTDGSPRLEFVERVAAEIGSGIRAKGAYHLVVFRSTMLPGTVEERLLPILERSSGRTAYRGFGLAYNPEFMREGTAVYDFDHPPKTVIGENDRDDGDLLASLYSGLPCPMIRTTIRVAEAVKYADNAFHALKVAFANEIGALCKACGLDGHEVMRILAEDTKLNLSPAYLTPGFAYGGSCLPKDLRAIVHEARRREVRVPLLEAIERSNAQQKLRVFEAIQQTGKRSVGILGLAFKAGTDDLRESPAVDLVERLLEGGYRVAIYDRNVIPAALLGSNKAYIAAGIPHLATMLRESAEVVTAESEVVVIANHDGAFEAIAGMLRSDQTLVDLVRLPKAHATKARYLGVAW